MNANLVTSLSKLRQDMSPGFDPRVLSLELASDPLPRLHQFYGAGHVYELGENQSQLEVYPASQMVRYASEDVNVSFPTQREAATQGSVVFDAGDYETTEHRTMVVNRDGGITLFVNSCNSLPAPETNDEAVDEYPDLLGCRSGGAASDTQLCLSCQGRGEILPEPVSALPESSAPESAIEHEAPTNTKAETNKGDRVVITGRAGRDPWLVQTKTGAPVAKSPLAEHVMDRETKSNVMTHRRYFSLPRPGGNGQRQDGDTLKVAG